MHRDDWVGAVDAFQAPCKSQADGMRLRDIVFQVAPRPPLFARLGEARRGGASGWGAPYYDLAGALKSQRPAHPER